MAELKFKTIEELLNYSKENDGDMFHHADMLFIHYMECGDFESAKKVDTFILEELMGEDSSELEESTYSLSLWDTYEFIIEYIEEN